MRLRHVVFFLAVLGGVSSIGPARADGLISAPHAVEVTLEGFRDALVGTAWGVVEWHGEANPHGVPVTLGANAFPIISDFNSAFGAAGGFRSAAGAPDHRGIDFKAPIGTPVIAAANGFVIYSRYHADGGQTIVIRHRNRVQGSATTYLETRYNFLNKRYVRFSDQVRAGQIIGEVGDSGPGAGDIPRLHFSVHTSSATAPQAANNDWELANPHEFWRDGPGQVTVHDASKHRDIRYGEPVKLLHPLPARDDVIARFKDMQKLEEKKF